LKAAEQPVMLLLIGSSFLGEVEIALEVYWTGRLYEGG